MGGERHAIKLNEFNHLEIDADRILYWDGEVVQTMSKLNLPFLVNAAIVLGGLGGFAAGIVSLISALHLT